MLGQVKGWMYAMGGGWGREAMRKVSLLEFLT